MSTWIPNIYANLTPQWRFYMAWPMMVAKLHVDGQLEGFSLGKGKKKGIVYDLTNFNAEDLLQI